MKDRVPWIIVAIVTIIVVVGAVLVLVTTDGGNASAMTIDGHSFSQKTISDDLASLSRNSNIRSNWENAGGVFSVGNGSVTSDFASAYLTQLVEARALQDELARRGLTVDPSLRAQLEQAADQSLGGLSKNARDAIVEANLGEQTLATVVGSDNVNAAVVKAIRRLRVTVDPRYGAFDRSQSRVCPPGGCPKASSSGSSSSGSGSSSGTSTPTTTSP
jgi:hypothetical protein